MGGQIYLGRRLGNVYVCETLPSVTYTELSELSHSQYAHLDKLFQFLCYSSGRIDPSFHSQCIWLIPSLRLKHDRYILEPLKLDGLS